MTYYATPSDFIARYGVGEATSLLSDEERLLTSTLLTEAIAGAFTGTPSEAEMQAATAAVDRLTRALSVSSNLMDGYMRSAVTLPLAGDDANLGVLNDCCLALTRFDIADDADNMTELMSKTQARWMTWLRDVAAGRVTLVVSATGTQVQGPSRVRTGQARSGFDWVGHGANSGWQAPQ